MTGFGLLGHLYEMLKAPTTPAAPTSDDQPQRPQQQQRRRRARVYLEAVPLLEGAAECAAAGVLWSVMGWGVWWCCVFLDTLLLTNTINIPRYPLLAPARQLAVAPPRVQQQQQPRQSGRSDGGSHAAPKVLPSGNLCLLS